MTNKLIGPFTQLLTMDKLPDKGSIPDSQLEIISNAGIMVDKGKIIEIGNYSKLKQKAYKQKIHIEYIEDAMVAMPGLIDCHTHICWGGSRAADYAKRLSGKTYLEIAEDGGGIWDTVQKTREAGLAELETVTAKHANLLLAGGVTSIEVKSGYGLNIQDELKMLKAIKNANTPADLIATCLAAHIFPKDFQGNAEEYLSKMAGELLPRVKEQKLADRVDIFVEKTAFTVDTAREYLQKAKALGFDLVIHGDQFTTGGSKLATEIAALSVDHLEACGNTEVELLKNSNVVSVVLPGASIGLGEPFAPARKLLDGGACVAIASDWNPGSAPMGDLLTQACILGVYEKLTIAETLSGITNRAAKALNLTDRGILKADKIADIAAFKTNDFREIIYRQGMLRPAVVWKNGETV
jgi:imidazolonepropionase